MSKSTFVSKSDPFIPKTRVNIKAEIVKVDPNTGIVTLAIESNPLPRELSEAMQKHFPHCYEEIEAICAKELLLSAFTNDGNLNDSIS